MDKAFAQYVLGKLAEKNADNPEFGRFVTEFNNLDGDAQKAELAAIATKMGVTQQADDAPELISPQAKVIRDVATTVSFGQAPKAVAALQAVGDVVASGDGFAAAYQKRRSRLTQEEELAKKEYGGAFDLASQAAGFMVPTGPLAALLGKATKIAKAATASKIGQAALAGGLSAGGYASLREAGDVVTGDASLREAATSVAAETAAGAAGGLAGGLISQATGEIVQRGAGAAKRLLKLAKGAEIETDTLLDDLSRAVASAKEGAARPSELASELSNETLVAKARLTETIDETANAVKTFIDKNKGDDAVETLRAFGQWVTKTQETASKAYASALEGIGKANKGVRPKFDRLASILDEANALQLADGKPTVLADLLPDLGPKERAFVKQALEDGLQNKLQWKDANNLRLILGQASDHNGDLNGRLYGALRETLAATDRTGGQAFNKLSADYHEYLKVLGPLRRAARGAAEGDYPALAKVMQRQIKAADAAGSSATALELGVERLRPQTAALQPVFPKETQAYVANTFKELRRSFATQAYAAKPQKLTKDVAAALTGGGEAAELKAVEALGLIRQKGAQLEDVIAQANLPKFVEKAVKNPNDRALRTQAAEYLAKHAPKALPRFNELHASAARYARLNDLPSGKSGLAAKLAEVADLDPATREQILTAYDFLPDFRKIVENPKVVQRLDKMLEENAGGLADLVMGLVARGGAGAAAGEVVHQTTGLPRSVTTPVAALLAMQNPTRAYNLLKGIEANAAARSATIAAHLNGPISRIAAGVAGGAVKEVQREQQ